MSADLKGNEGERWAEPLPVDLPLVPPNQPLPVFHGPVAVTHGSSTAQGEATVRIRWVPEPALECRVDLAPTDSSTTSSIAGELGRDVTIEVAGSTLKGRLRGGSWLPSQPWLELRIYAIAAVGSGDATQLRFELVNMEDVYGAPVQHGDSGWGADRLKLSSGKWTVEIDAVTNLHEIHRELNTNGGYAVLHRGRAILNDGGAIQLDDAQNLVTTLQYTLSFAERRWITPVRARGLSPTGTPAWEMWGLWCTDPWSTPVTWFSHRSVAGLADTFKVIDDRWPDQYWERLLRTAMHYYLEATRGFVNRQIIMGASLLELIGWHAVVEDQQLLTPNAYDRLEASDRLRTLFGLLNIPTEIARELGALRRYARPGWDAAKAITEIRHSVVHAKRHQAAWELDTEVWTDAVQLNQQLCDLAMLYLLSYSGEYVDPVVARYAADARPVPWART
jgi:hypothetical protein